MFHSIIRKKGFFEKIVFGFKIRKFVRISKSITSVSCGNYIIQVRRLIFVDLIKETKLSVLSTDLK